MKKENILFITIGLLLGFIVGFMFANTSNQRGYAREAAAGGQPQQAAGLPEGHPPIDGATNAGPSAAEIENVTKYAAGARAALAKLESVNPQSAALPRLRAELDKLGSPQTAKN